ncbi:aldo/keto reductase [Tunturiibacter empetritectus]|uniref:Aryl-alcohol dehydrogenase-like predicted oxidoreductase n=1 Tax=Tunturiibacter lichenicola TaxID=2051959 RepID=A0A852V932_9BACT|nr:aldo/keto reductase [Edaphobacter lichenicola]NYF89458.1 aryl-alcohol dehydrogenase-like predicted oxidoreductase [Edaphobacter lichenicola]
MQLIELADTRRRTTTLGFGCSNLMGAMDRRASLAILESAYDAGIRHFDVAPMYGYGEAEGCLGEFLQRYRDHVTVTTKYGIPPAKKRPLISLARRVAGPILKAVPSAKHRLAQAANAAMRTSEKATFTPQQAKASLECSLAALRTDRIDLWLLHEATAADLRDEALLSLLEEEMQQGTIGSFGIGSSADKIPSLLVQHPAYCRTLQYEWSVLDPEADPEANPPFRPERSGVEKPAVLPPSPFRIHHRALTENFRSLHRTLSQDKQLSQRWSASTNIDLSNPDHLAHLMLKAALVMNPRSIILFSSKDPLHIQANAKTAEDRTLEAPARELHRLVQTERNRL